MNINGKDISCKKDDFIMILPNTVHSFEVKENEQCEFLHIHFEPELFAHILVKKHLNSPYHFQMPCYFIAIFIISKYQMLPFLI